MWWATSTAVAAQCRHLHSSGVEGSSGWRCAAEAISVQSGHIPHIVTWGCRKPNVLEVLDGNILTIRISVLHVLSAIVSMRDDKGCKLKADI